jgi:hypothetical protein
VPLARPDIQKYQRVKATLVYHIGKDGGIEPDKKYRIFAGKMPVSCRDCLVPTLYPPASIAETAETSVNAMRL